MIDAAVFPNVDRQKLVVLVQSKQSSDDDDSELSAPDTATYRSHSSDIIDVPTVTKSLHEGKIVLQDTLEGYLEVNCVDK